jgi:hypothetical protein
MTLARTPFRRLLLIALAVGGGPVACSGQDRASQATQASAVSGAAFSDARTARVERLVRERARSPGRADGQGRAWLGRRLGTRPRVQASQEGRWSIVYEAGETGIAVGGSIRLLIPPFLGWTPPQLTDPQALGYVTVAARAPGVGLRVDQPEPLVIRVGIADRELRHGERIRFVYGAGPARARADSSAERDSRFWISVDGDGDGIGDVLPDSPAIDIEPGPPRRLHVVWPTTARPGEVVQLHVSVLDANGNAGIPWSGEVALAGLPSSVEGARAIAFTAAHRGTRSAELRVSESGIYRVVATAADGLAGESNPLVIAAGGERVLWADLHGHSNVSDGTGLPEDFFRYARDVAGLDAAALTDHDHHGAPRYLDENEDVWESIRTAVRRSRAPGRFVSILGYEWTSWLHGHRHVLYFGDDGPVRSALDPRHDAPPKLWAALRGDTALTIAHHPAGGPMATNWAIAPDPALEPLVEVASRHGSSEALETPGPVKRTIEGSFVRDALDRGYRLGFVGSSDSHDGHPGCVQEPGRRSCGLAAILSRTATREAILGALRARRTYATSGPRILLRVALDGEPMGSAVAAAPSRTLAVQVVAPVSLARVDVLRSGRIAEVVAGNSRTAIAFERELTDLVAGEYVYVRAVQEDDGAAWSSPFFVDPPAPTR